jgi:hypothetical protein
MSAVESFFDELNSYGGAKRRRAAKKSPRRRSPARVVYVPRRPTFEEEIADAIIRDKLYRPVVKKVYKTPSPKTPSPSAPAKPIKPSGDIALGGKKKRSPKRR